MTNVAIQRLSPMREQTIAELVERNKELESKISGLSSEMEASSSKEATLRVHAEQLQDQLLGQSTDSSVIPSLQAELRMQ
jgi:phage shock protein A